MSRDDEEGWQIETEEVQTEDEEDDGDDEWRFSLEDLEADEDEEDEQSAVGGNVFGSLDSDREVVEAGSPDIENVLFVVVGVVLALAVFVQFALLFS